MRASLLRALGCRFDPWTGVDLRDGSFPAPRLHWREWKDGMILHKLPDGTEYLRSASADKLTAASFVSRDRCIFA